MTQLFWNLGLVFDFKYSDGRSASIRQHPFTTFRQRYSIQIRNGPGYEASSAPNGHVSTIRMDEKDVAKVSKKRFSVSNAWEIEIGEGIDPLLVIASAIVFVV